MMDLKDSNGEVGGRGDHKNLRHRGAPGILRAWQWGMQTSTLLTRQLRFLSVSHFVLWGEIVFKDKILLL